jgi:hypothetical protein
MKFDKQTFIQSKFSVFVAFVYLTGIIIHSIRLITNAQPSELIPLWFDYWVVTGTLYGSIILGIAITSSDVEFDGLFNKSMSLLVFLHLIITVVFHGRTIITQDNTNFDVFPYWYSIIVIIWFALFGFWILTSNQRISK